jgi:hypothetical protein
MFPRRFFPGVYFAATYFPVGGSGPPPPPPSSMLHEVLFLCNVGRMMNRG